MELDVRARLVGLVAAIPRASSYGAVFAAGLSEELAGGSPPFLLDVREPDELERDGHIAGAVNLPLRGLIEHLDWLPARDRPIVVYCASSHRGAIAAAALRLLGYTSVRNLAFGFAAWSEAGLPVAEGPPAAGSSPSEGPAIESRALHGLIAEFLASAPHGFHATTAAAVHAELASGRHAFLLDVRRPEQLEQDGRIQGAVNLPFEVLFGSLDRLPSRDTPIVVFCASGHRSAIAVLGLHLMGYARAVNVDGGVTAWRAAGLPLVATGSSGTR